MLLSTEKSGMSLVSLLVALGILSILVVIFSTSIKNSWNASQRVHNQADKENLRNFLRMSVSCQETFENLGPNCTGQYVEVHSKKKTVIIGIPAGTSSFSSFGKFDLAAKCVIKDVDRGTLVKVMSIDILQRSNVEKTFTPLFSDIQLCELIMNS